VTGSFDAIPTRQGIALSVVTTLKAMEILSPLPKNG
jgi:hypothetical protein